MDNRMMWDLHNSLSNHLDTIGKLFVRQPRITLVCRCPWLDDGDTVIGDDDLTEAIRAIEKKRDHPSAFDSSKEVQL